LSGEERPKKEGEMAKKGEFSTKVEGRTWEKQIRDLGRMEKCHKNTRKEGE
jgi:hypothetical protein